MHRTMYITEDIPKCTTIYYFIVPIRFPDLDTFKA